MSALLVGVLALVVLLGPWLLMWLHQHHRTWNVLLSGAIWAAVLRSSPALESGEEAMALAHWTYVLLVAGLTVLPLFPSSVGRSARSSAGPIGWFWLLAAYALAVGLVIDPAKEFPSLLSLLALGALASVAYVRRWHDRRTLERDATTIFLGLASLLAASVGAGLLGLDWAFGIHGSLSGIFGNPNYLGLAAALVCCMALGRVGGKHVIPRWANAGVLALALSSLLWSGSRGALAALLAGVSVVIVMEWRRPMSRNRGVLTALLAACSLTLLFLVPGFFDRSSRGVDFLSGRGEIWQELFGQVSWLGKGLYGTQYVRQATGLTPPEAEQTLEAHSVYLQFLVGLGVVGLVLLVGFVASLFMGPRSNPALGFTAPAAVVVLTYELTESSITGAGGPLAMVSWLLMFAQGAASHYAVSRVGVPSTTVDKSGVDGGGPARRLSRATGAPGRHGRSTTRSGRWAAGRHAGSCARPDVPGEPVKFSV